MGTVDTRRKVRITTNHSKSINGQPIVLVDEEVMYGVTHIEIDHHYSDIFKVKLTLIGVDVDLEGSPDYIVKVVGPRPEEVRRVKQTSTTEDI